MTTTLESSLNSNQYDALTDTDSCNRTRRIVHVWYLLLELTCTVVILALVRVSVRV